MIVVDVSAELITKSKRMVGATLFANMYDMLVQVLRCRAHVSERLQETRRVRHR